MNLKIVLIEVNYVTCEPSVEKSKLSIKQAREWLVEVEKNLEKYLFNFSMVYGM